MTSLGTAALLMAPRRVQVPLPIEVTERFLTVRLVKTNDVVCILEILSPANKRPGERRIAYETKRRKILGSATHLVEIDLLCDGESMAIASPGQKTYSILVSISRERLHAALYEFALADTIPAFPVPLKTGDAAAIVDLQPLLNNLYTRARFDLAIDYGQLLKPALSKENANWI
ncbi:MAG: DUF4058 family protein [Cyanobacteria bacterium P01_C01_bin.120]